MSHSKNCPDCGTEQTYGNIYRLQRAIKNNTKCKKCCYNSGRFTERPMDGYVPNNGYYVYHIPAEYYVGITKDPMTRRLRQHDAGKDVTDMHIVSDGLTVYEALEMEARYHGMGYTGCADTPIENLNREIYKEKVELAIRNYKTFV